MSDPSWFVRPMTMEDIDAVEAIERESFTIPWSRGAFIRELTVNVTTARYLVLDQDGAVVGYAGMWLVIDEGHITNVAVRRGCRNRGGGLMLMRALIAEGIENGLVYMTLEVRRSNLIAQNLYHRMGFVDVGFRKRYYEDDREDALVMACEDLPKALSGGWPQQCEMR
ncbi:MAG: ribosomal protein S18-alanine N-acetyltransferase [Oscillospiraceae bacterium]|jgi:ribosomal-protein-alanine N-acetyltransferase|nr:ribosomal protein S18-alanine N-acetyltransferase [Oscillospiraceae bacterium]